MRLSHEEREVLAAFDRAPLASGLHPLVGVMRAMRRDVSNPTKRANTELALQRLVALRHLRSVHGTDGLDYYVRVSSARADAPPPPREGSRLRRWSAAPTSGPHDTGS